MSSKAPSNTTTTVKNEMPSWLQPYATSYMDQAGALASNPYQSYGGDKIAPLSDQSVYGMQMAQNTALGGTPYADMAMGAGANIMGSSINNQNVDWGGYNPYTAGLGNATYNPYADQSNPWLQSMIDQSAGSITDKYMNSTAPQLNAMEMQQGAFGNTGLAQMKLQAANDLTGSLGDIENQYRFQDYAQRAQLAEQFAGRNDQMRTSQAGLAEQERNRILNASGQNASNNLQAQIANEQNDLSAMGMSSALEQLRYLPSEQMMGIGDYINNYNQTLADDRYQDWMAENMYPYQQVDVLGNAIGLMMGSGGTQTTNAPNANRPNTAANLLGAGLTAYGLLS